jgi:prepilin-type N-terminal cleavage/methylation domain-containing protein
MSRRGFTLIELMATMAIGGGLLLLAAGLLGRAGQGYARGSDGVAAEREARAALALIADDLAQAVWHRDCVLDPGGGDGWPRARLGLLSLQAGDAQSDQGRAGDLCAIHYQLRDLRIGQKTVRCLMRGFHDSAAVFPSLAAGSAAPLFEARDDDEPLAFGVLAFEARPLVRKADGKLADWVPDEARSQAPDFVRLRLVIARRDLLAKLSTAADWDAHPLLGDPARAAEHPQLEVHESLLRFGSHD